MNNDYGLRRPRPNQGRAGGRIACLTATLLASPVAAPSDVDGPFVSDAVAQFNALTRRADALGFYRGDSPDPTSCKHYQASARVQGPDGTPYFYVTRSGNTPSTCVTGSNDPGNLLIVRMDSRDKHAERMRSNRVMAGVDISFTPPPAEDRVVRHITFDDAYGWPSFGHPGSMQLVGHILAVALETSYDPSYSHRQVLFLDVSDPENPVRRSMFTPDDADSDILTGSVGVTRMRNGRYLMVLSGGEDNAVIGFYESNPTEPDGSTDLGDPNLWWTLIDRVKPKDWDEDKAAYSYYDTGEGYPGPGSFWTGAHQTLQFLREGSLQGPLFLAGARGAIVYGEDWLDLIEVQVDESVTGPREVRLRRVASRHMHSDPTDHSTADLANFAAGVGYYVSPAGELIFYATEHDNDGPNESVKMGEWRHVNMARDYSPVHLPRILVGQEYQVREGSATVLAAAGRPPVSRPSIQLYADSDFGYFYHVVDLDDYHKDSFDDFKDIWVFDFLIGYPYQNHRLNNAASSVRWYAPVGCTIYLRDLGASQSGYPGGIVRTLVGMGYAEKINDLGSELDDFGAVSMNDRISSVAFDPACQDYYAAQITPQWDLDRDGTYEVQLESPVFSADALDGPSEVTVPLRAVHPWDGQTAHATTRVKVFNVAPVITGHGLFDSAGRRIGVDTPFVLTGMPVTASASFTDAGQPDRQSAEIDWGDGTTDAHAQFGSFSDAYGGATGQLSHTHRYTTDGRLTVKIVVTDDDGGMTQAAQQADVLTPAGAIERIADDIAALMAVTADRKARQWLTEALRDLIGGDGGKATDGALDKLLAGNVPGTLGKLEDARKNLLRAQEGGANTAALVIMIGHLITVLSSS